MVRIAVKGSSRTITGAVFGGVLDRSYLRAASEGPSWLFSKPDVKPIWLASRNSRVHASNFSSKRGNHQWFTELHTAAIRSAPASWRCHLPAVPKFSNELPSNDFDRDNDSFNEHDFIALADAIATILPRSSTMPRILEHGSEDPADPDKTVRIMTVMTAEEY